MSALVLIWLDAADVVRSALHQFVNQVVGLRLQGEGRGGQIETGERT